MLLLFSLSAETEKLTSLPGEVGFEHRLSDSRACAFARCPRRAREKMGTACRCRKPDALCVEQRACQVLYQAVPGILVVEGSFFPLAYIKV